jgi:alkaline phosphatase D
MGSRFRGNDGGLRRLLFIPQLAPQDLADVRLVYATELRRDFNRPVSHVGHVEFAPAAAHVAITPSETRTRFMGLDEVRDPKTIQRELAAFRVEDGKPGVEITAI